MSKRQFTLNMDSLEIMNEILINIHNGKPDNILVEFCLSLKKILNFDLELNSLYYHKHPNYIHFNFNSENMASNYIDDYVRKYYHNDFCAWFNEQTAPKVFRDSDIIKPELLEQTDIYKKWYAPQDLYYAVMISVCGNDKKLASIGLFRSKESGDFTDDEVRLLKIFNMHLCSRFKELYPKGIAKPLNDNRSIAFASNYSLTRREFELIQLVKSGVSRDKLAERMYISQNTVKKHIANIYKKMNITNSMQFISIINKE